MQNLTTHDLTLDDLCELATECNGSALEDITGLIDGLLAAHGADDRTCAVLWALRDYHLPRLVDDLTGANGAD